MKKKKVETKNLMFDANDEYLIKKQNESDTNTTKVLHLKSIGII